VTLFRKSWCRVATLFGLVLTVSVARAGDRYPVTWDSSLVVGGASAGSQVGLRDLLTRRWQVGDEAIVFDVRNSEGLTMVVDDCDALFKADAEGMQPVAYPDFKQYRAWAVRCYSVRAVSQASDAAKSFVDSFAMDEAHIRQLPVELAVVISRDDEREVQRIARAGGRLGDYLGNASIQIESPGPLRGAMIKDVSGGTEGLRWLASGDFDHDGTGDLLISTYSTVAGGSYESQGLYVVGRESEGAPMKVLAVYPVMGSM